MDDADYCYPMYMVSFMHAAFTVMLVALAIVNASIMRRLIESIEQLKT